MKRHRGLLAVRGVEAEPLAIGLYDHLRELLHPLGCNCDRLPSLLEALSIYLASRIPKRGRLAEAIPPKHRSFHSIHEPVCD
jgi:hypothetical protein